MEKEVVIAAVKSLAHPALALPILIIWVAKKSRELTH